MQPSATPQMGPAGPYHHPMPPQMPYHNDQIPTTSHPSWQNGSYPCLPTPPYHQYPPQQHQQNPNYPPMTPHHPIPPPQQHHPQMTPQALTQQQQQQVQQQQQRSAYSSPSPSLGPAVPVQKQLRTEQWVRQWPYAQSPAPSVAPSVMSYHQNDDQMSMLSVNTTMTHQFPETQRCFSSNGSTCENVNPEFAATQLAPAAEQAMKEWFSTPDPSRKMHMIMTIREWVKRDKFLTVDQSKLPNVVQHLLNIIYDGLKPQPVPLPHVYYAQLYGFLLDILLRIVYYPTTLPYLNLVIQMFRPNENNPMEFRSLFFGMLKLDIHKPEHMQYTIQIFQFLELIFQHLNNPKHEKMRLDFYTAVRFARMFDILMEYLTPQLAPHLLHPVVLIIFRFIMSKDTDLKNRLIWAMESQRERLPNTSIIFLLMSILMRFNNALMAPEMEPAPDLLKKQLLLVISRTFDLLKLILHDQASTNEFVRNDGIGAICNVINRQQNPDVVRSGFNLLLHVSDARALSLINLKDILPFIIDKIRECLKSNETRKNREDDVLYCGTGFLSNAIAHKQPAKERAIANNAIGLLYEIIWRYTPLNELREALKRARISGIIDNSLRTLNNFLMMWIPTQNGPNVEAELHVRQQVCRFIEPEFLKKLMTCLSIEGIDSLQMMELRSTILRFFLLILKIQFIPKQGLLDVIDDSRKKNIVGHILTAFSLAMGQPTSDKTRDVKIQLVERVFTVLVRLIDQCGAAREVALEFYAVNCPLSLIDNNQAKPAFILNVLIVCDHILRHNPLVANVWSVDRSKLEHLNNHSNSDIVRAAGSVLSKLPDIDPLAVILSNC